MDEDNGVVVLWMNFGHTGNSYGEGNSLVSFEAFKVWGGEIHAINAFFKSLPVGPSRFWSTSDPIVAPPSRPTADHCMRRRTTRWRDSPSGLTPMLSRPSRGGSNPPSRSSSRAMAPACGSRAGKS
jgi:hypothetical protein